MWDNAFSFCSAAAVNPLAGELPLAHTPLAREHQERLRNLATLVSYSRAKPIYSEGDEARYIYFVSSGLVRVFRSTEDGKRQIIAFRTPGDVCGLPQDGYYMNSAETVPISMIYRLPWDLFNRLLLTTPQLQMMLLRKVISEFRDAQSRIMILGQENIVHRVATFLVHMMTVRQFFEEEQSLLYLPMNRFDVADYLGTTSETAGRAFTKLETMGIIRRISPRRIEILDAKRLRGMQRGPRRSSKDKEMFSGFPFGGDANESMGALDDANVAHSV